jgi:predicted nuclease of predicted toxin-antitoxin system
VRFLVDENLSPRLAELLSSAGQDAVHVRGLRAAGEPDETIMSLAVQHDRVIVSADTDFGTLLAASRATQPSVLLVRALVDRRPPELAGIILANLDILQEHVETGAVVAFTKTGIRVRELPLR